MNEQTYDNAASHFERVLTQHYPEVQWYVYRLRELPSLDVSTLMGAPESFYVRAKNTVHTDDVIITDVPIPDGKQDEAHAASFAYAVWLDAATDA